MTATTVVEAGHDHGDFRHEALFYAGLDEFRSQTLGFIRQGIEADEDILVVVSAAKVAMLRDELGGDADAVRFADMADVGRNPSCIIPVWQEFVAGRDQARGMRGIGEPAYAERSTDELAECRRHEFLLNLAFAGSPAWRLLCPYDTTSLDPSVVAEARRTHPYLVDARGYVSSDEYDPDGPVHSMADPLPEPPPGAEELAFERSGLDDVRRFVSRQAVAVGLPPVRVDDLVLAVHEVATNSLRHGGGGGAVRLWTDGAGLVCEVRDRGVIREPMVGRVRPAVDQENGRGLWIVNQLCDLVQVRSSSAGSVVRLRMNF